MAEFGDTKIYTAEGIDVSAGSFQNSLFSESKRLSDALTNAGGINPAVAPGWQTTSEFEEWTDRLILKRTTTFTLLDGDRFHGDFFTGTEFTSHPNVETDPAVAPEMLALAATYIEDDKHLSLYPAARAAGETGAQELLDELGNDTGPVTFVEVIEFSRIVPVLRDPLAAGTVLGSIVKSNPQSGQTLADQLNFTPRASFQSVVQPGGISTMPKADLNASSTYRQEMLNGFTIGNTWSKSISYSRNWMSFKTSAYATFGIGVRIPWEATVQVGPRRIAKSSPDKTPYKANLSIETLDADEDFYRRVGLPEEHLFDGQEAVLRAEAGITLELEVLGKTIFDRDRGNPLISRGLDLGRNFDPPLGTTLNVASPELLYEQSGLAYQHWAFAIGGDLKADIGITGRDFELIAEPHNGWTKTGVARLSKEARTIEITDENSPEFLEFACDDSSTITGRGSDCRYYRHGVNYSGAEYHTSLDITPQARVRVKVKLSNMVPGVSDVNLSSPWVDLFTASFDLPALGPHDDTEDTINAYTKNKRELNAFGSDGLTRQCELDLDTNKWSVEVVGSFAGVNEIVEQLPQNAVVAAVSEGGIYDPSTHSIRWFVINGEPTGDISYELTTPTTDFPKVVGQTRSPGGVVKGIRSFGSEDADEAVLLIRNSELAKRPTFQELVDGRPKSKIYRAEDGKVRMQLKFQTSEDMTLWTDEGIPWDQEIELPAGRRYFRFGIE